MTQREAWECNECGAQEYSTNISERDVHELGCGRCGSSEWHKAPEMMPAQAQAAAQCIGKDPLCPCQDGDTCHYEGKDAWPVPQHFPFMPWSKETEMMKSWAKHGAVEPVAWMHDETGLIVRVSDIAKTSYNEPRIKSGEFSPLYASQPDHTKAMRLALEIIRLQREWIMAVPQDTVLPSMPGFDREWVDRQIAALEKELT